MASKRTERKDAKPYKRESSARYTSTIDSFPHGRWTENESLTILVLYKIARRMQSSTTDVIDMYSLFSSHDRQHQPKDQLKIREKTPGQITKKIVHLNCDIETLNDNENVD